MTCKSGGVISGKVFCEEVTLEAEVIDSMSRFIKQQQAKGKVKKQAEVKKKQLEISKQVQ